MSTSTSVSLYCGCTYAGGNTAGPAWYISRRGGRHQQVLGEFQPLPNLVIISNSIVVVVTAPRLALQEVQQEQSESVAKRLQLRRPSSALQRLLDDVVRPTDYQPAQHSLEQALHRPLQLRKVHILCTRTATHKRPFNGPFSGTTRVSRYQNGKTNLDLLKQET